MRLPITPGSASFTCPDCNGSGEGHYDGARCRTCGGRGEIPYECDREREEADAAIREDIDGAAREERKLLDHIYDDFCQKSMSQYDVKRELRTRAERDERKAGI